VFLGFLIVMFASGAILWGQEAPARGESLSLEELIKFAKAGEADDLIIARIKRNAKAFDLNADEIAELQKSGMSGVVIRYLVDPSLPYSPAPPPAPAAGPPVAPPLVVKPPSDPIALKVPPDSGIYYLTDHGDFVTLHIKPVVPSKQPGRIAAISGGLLGGHIIGSVIDSSAKTRVAGRNATFYLRLGEKATIDDLALLSLHAGEGRRNLDFGTKVGKPVFPVKAVRSFDSKEMATGLFRLSVPLTSPGEYLFFLLGSGDDKKGLLGRGYDFGVDQ
jgi:hypothetical protein